MIAHETLIELHDLSVRFGRQTVLRDIQLEVPRGQTLAIIGESGSGKTVLLKTIIGLVRPTQGQVRFDGQVVGDLGERQMTQLRTRFGFVFQNAALFDSMTVRQNLAFPLDQHRKSSPADYDRIISLRLQEVGLTTSVLPKKPAELSGGMRKRVGLARALAMDPEVLLYDEPTTGLDPIMTDVINELMMRTRSRYQVTSIIVTHDMKTARKVADRIVMVYPLSRLKPGERQIIYDGPAEEIDQATDRRVRQFVRGEAGERLMELGERPLG